MQFLLTYLLTTFRPSASALRAPPTVGHTIRSQGLFSLVFVTSTRSFHPSMATNHRIKHSSRKSVFIHPNEMAETAEPLVINTISNAHVIEELIQLPVTVVIENSYWNKNLAQHFSLEHSQGSCIGA